MPLPPEIPFRSLFVKDTKNLLMAGRCISVTHEADRNMRNIVACVVTGQAAGTAAALSSKYGIPLLDLNIRLLQSALRRQEVDFGREVPGLVGER